MGNKTDFREFAERIDALAKDTRSKLTEADEELRRAEDIKTLYPKTGDTTPEYLAKVARAEADYQTALAMRDDLRAVLMASVEREVVSIEKDLEKAVDAEFSADPSELDAAVMALLSSGIHMRPSEYDRLLDGAILAKNWTTARAICAAAERAAMEQADQYGMNDHTAQEYRATARTEQRLAGKAYLQNYGVLSDTLHRCMKNPALWPKWEALTEEIVAEGFR